MKWFRQKEFNKFYQMGLRFLAIMVTSASCAYAASPVEMFKYDAPGPKIVILFAHSRDLGIDAVFYATSIDSKKAFGELNERDSKTWRSQYEAMPDEIVSHGVVYEA